MKLYNFNWGLSSGIGKYNVDFTQWIKASLVNAEYITGESFYISNDKSTTTIAIYQNVTSESTNVNGFRVKIEIVQGSGGGYRYYNSNGSLVSIKINESKIYDLPSSIHSGLTSNGIMGFTINQDSIYKVTQIPEYEMH